MVEFNFPSTGKFKLITARMSKSDNRVYFVCSKTSKSMKILSNRCCVKIDDIEYSRIENDCIFSIDSIRLHNVSKNLIANKEYIFQVIENKLKISSKTEEKNSKILISIMNHNKLPKSIIPQLSNININDGIQQGSIKVNIRDLIWVVEKYEEVFDEIFFVFNDDLFTVSGLTENYNGCSEINLIHSCKNLKFSKKINPTELLLNLWNLEYISSEGCFLMLNDELCVASNSENGLGFYICV
jgi:hypothetical protein